MSAGLSVIIPTQGRDTLERCLASCVAQGLTAADQVWVVIDAHEMSFSAVTAISERVHAFGERFFVLSRDAGHHCWGHCQLNFGMEYIPPGNYIVFNDDDDVFTPEAFAAIRAAVAGDEVAGPRLHVFKFRTHLGRTLPAGEALSRGAVGGHCLVVPNLPGRVGRFSCDYEGDWDMIEDTAARWDDDIVFHEAIIAVCRPS